MTATPSKAPGYYDNGRNGNGRHHQNGDGQRWDPFWSSFLSHLILKTLLNHFRHYNGDRDYPRGYQNGEQIPRSGGGGSYADRTYSLPRTVAQSQNHPGYYTQDRRQRYPQQQRSNGHKSHASNDKTNGHGSGADTPDFYFMPSQRKYSGEVVRVYVDYNKEPK